MSKQKAVKNQQYLPEIVGGLVCLVVSIYLFYILNKGAGIYPANLSKDLGTIGAFVYRIVHSIAGQGGWIVPTFLLFLAIALLLPRLKINRRIIISVLVFCCLILGWKHLSVELSKSITYGLDGVGGGLIGALVSYLFIWAFGNIGAKLFLIALMIITAYIGSSGKLFVWFKQLGVKLKPLMKSAKYQLKDFIFVETEDNNSSNKNKEKKSNILKPRKSEKALAEKAKTTPVEPDVFIRNTKNIQDELIENKRQEIVETHQDDVLSEPLSYEANKTNTHYEKPSIDLLDPVGEDSFEIDKSIIDQKVHTLESTLDDFGVQGKVNAVSIGPAVTEYEYQPAPGVKVSKILNLADDIALNLAANDVRIQAPIPGKPAVGIEVPNDEVRVVKMKEMIGSKAFQESKSKLSFVLGKDISGRSIVSNLADMPHLLIAGATGSGKSVCLNALILSILFKADPDEVKFLMIDPKMVELGHYNDIPHLLSPVVTNSKKAASTLRWAVKEMERRYELFAKTGAKDHDRYNQKFLEEKVFNEETPLKYLPKIVIIIDELADLMMVAPADVEDAIARLAQMARAAGIHLVIATQRPSVDVITGTIKANIPSRIAFSVSSQVDSRIILDVGGAEKLLGRGDMLFYPTGLAKPKRIQGVYVTDDEISRIVSSIKKQGSPIYDNEVANLKAEESTHAEETDEYDELLQDACRLFIENGSASISMLQRNFRIGYTRAARIIDQLEALGFVGPYEGSKPRRILMTMDEYNKIFSKG